MSTFDDAVRRYFKVPDDFRVYSALEGGKEYQLGEYTWDTEPYEITISVKPPPVIMKYDTPGWRPGTREIIDVETDDRDRDHEAKTMTFPDLPSLWKALA